MTAASCSLVYELPDGGVLHAGLALEDGIYPDAVSDLSARTVTLLGDALARVHGVTGADAD